MKSSPLPATLVVIAAAGFFMPSQAEEKSYSEKLREIGALAKQERTEWGFYALQSSMWIYQSFCGDFPSEEQGLGALVEKPALEPVPVKWRQAINTLPQDAWGRSYRYVIREQNGAREHLLISDGPDLVDKNDNLEWAVYPLEKTDESRARHQLRHISLLLGYYQIVCDRLPTEEQGLSALRERPVLEPVPEIWIPLGGGNIGHDPWDRPYRYRVREEDGTQVHVLSSDGPDPDDKKDDIELVVKPRAVEKK